MKITINHCMADVTTQQIELYMRNNGWKRKPISDESFVMCWHRPPILRVAYLRADGKSFERWLTSAIDTIAFVEQRAAHLVLTDIAALVEPKPS